MAFSGVDAYKTYQTSKKPQICKNATSAGIWKDPEKRRGKWLASRLPSCQIPVVWKRASP